MSNRLKRLLEEQWEREGCRFHSNLCKWHDMGDYIVAEKGSSRRQIKRKDRFKRDYIDDRYSDAALEWYRNIQYHMAKQS